MKKIILFFCLLIFFSALFFFLGENYQQKKLERMRNQFFNRNFPISTQRPDEKIKRERGALNFQMGRIVSHDEKTMTLKLENGNQRIVSIDEKTQFLKGEKISPQEIQDGQRVILWGKEISSDIFGANLVFILPSD
jgi:hypothetical protein